MDRDTIELDIPEANAHVAIVTRTWQSAGSSKAFNRNTRVFVSGVDALPELVIEDLTLPEPIATGVDPANDKAYAKRNRLYGKLTKDVAVAVTQHLFEKELVRGDKNAKLRFSAHAGCSCPCSPGVIVDDVLRAGAPVDIFVTLRNGPHND